MSYAIQYVWLSFVAWLTLRAFGFTPEEFRSQRRQLTDELIENKRLRIAFVRAKEMIAALRRDAITLPNLPAAEPMTRRSMRAAKPCEYLTVTPPGDDVEIPR